jgi:hypothetical protein
MPMYDYLCEICNAEQEKWARTFEAEPPQCCGVAMIRKSCACGFRMKYPAWVDRIDEIQKRQTQNGEKMRMVHPKEVGATY